MPRRKQVWRYSKAQRDKVLDTARRENLSGAEVAKRFGISQHTYYSWRSPARGIHVKTKRQAAAMTKPNGKANGELLSTLRDEVRRVLPDIVKEEVNAYLVQAFGSRGPGRPRTRV